MRRNNGTGAQAQARAQRKKFIFFMLFLVIACLVMFVVSVSVGRATKPIQIARIVLGLEEGTKQLGRIITKIRLPRALASFLVGACLAVSGLVYQTTFNNKLVSPDILGVSAGCCVGAGTAILLGLSPVLIRMMSFGFGLFAVLVAVLLPRLFRNRSALTLILSGIIVGSLMDSVLALIKYIADKKEVLSDIIFWIMGSLTGIQLDEVATSAMICIIPLAVLVCMSWRINVISLGTEEAESLGINYRANRLIVVICATLLTANCVSISGSIGWIGLVIPHIARAFAGDDVRKSLPAAAFCGGLFLLVVDTLSRLLSVNEIPLSIITGFLGAIIYTAVLVRKGRYLNE